MRIAYVLDEPLPSTETSGEQAINTLVGICHAGAEVTLLLPRSMLSAPSTRADVCAYYGVEPVFELEHLRSLFPSHRAIEKPAHAVRALLDGRARNYDVIYTRNVPVLVGGLALGYRVAYETYRPWPVQYPVFAPIFRAAMAHDNFLGALVHSDYARRCYLRLGIAEDKVQVLHNGFEPSRLRPVRRRRDARRVLGLPVEGPLAVYVGRVTVAKGVDRVLDMAAAVPGVNFVLVGSEGAGIIEQRAAALPNVHMFPWQSFDALANFLHSADVLVIPPTLAPLASNTVLPMKLFLYLAAGRAILAPQSPDTAELLVHNHNAWLVPPDDIDSASTALTALTQDIILAHRLGKEAERYSREFTWSARGRRLVDFIAARL